MKTKNYWKTFWHCLTHLHRMCYYREAGSITREYFCECSERAKEIFEHDLS